MRNISKFIIIAVFGLCGVDVAADELVVEPSDIVARYNCVVEKNGKLTRSEGFDELLCCFL